MQQRLLRLLCNRLRMLRDFREHPEIEDQQLVRPVFLTGGARTGSTKLHKMLSAGGDFKYLPFWQGHALSLRDGNRNESPDERIQEADEYIAWFDRSAPQAKATHSYGTFEPEEEIIVMEHNIICGFFLTLVYIPTYLKWCQEQGSRGEYEFLKRALKYLQWQFHDGDSRPWLLKCPIHLGFEQFLIEAFPDAVLITTNRRPINALPSSMSTINNYYKAYSEVDFRRAIGTLLLEGRAWILDQHIQNRDRDCNLRFLDLSYSGITQNAADVVKQVYAYAGMTLSAGAARAMRTWETNHPKEALGVHRYSLEEFFVTEDALNSKVRRYVERFAHSF